MLCVTFATFHKKNHCVDLDVQINAVASEFHHLSIIDAGQGFA